MDEPRKKGADLYVRALACLQRRPMEREELGRELGLSRYGGYRLADDLHALGLVDVVRAGYRQTYAAKTIGLPAVEVPKKKPRDWALIFWAVYDALESLGPIGQIEIHQQTGVNAQVVRRVLRAMRAANMAHIDHWSHGDFTGPMTAMWKLGEGSDARPRKKDRVAYNRQYYADKGRKQTQLAILTALRPDLIRESA